MEKMDVNYDINIIILFHKILYKSIFSNLIM